MSSVKLCGNNRLPWWALLLAVFVAVPTIQAATADTDISKPTTIKFQPLDSLLEGYDNEGTSHQIFINKKNDDVDEGHSQLPPNDNKQTSPYAGFNIDNILDLMDGDDQGNVNFGAIGIELANNLANVIDMNEVGSMATSLGLMMSGMGAAAEVQRKVKEANANAQTVPNDNNMLNNGIAALIGQVIANQPSGLMNGETTNYRDMATNNRQMSQLLHMVANVGSNDNSNIQNINQLMDNPMNSGTTTKNPNVQETSSEPKDKKKANPTNMGDLMAELVSGNDTSGMSSIAQAIGVRNFFKTDEKRIPDGCPSCFNCLYPGSVCAHNATCNKFTGRCDCPSGWTGEDCLQPACKSPLDEGKRPMAKNGHCHQDTECRPGWGGWNCNMCLTDNACDGLNPTGEGGRCYNGSELITNVVGQCTVGNKDISRYLPDGVTPKMTFGCNRSSSSCDAQFWINGKEAFYCNLDQCSIGTWGSLSTASIDCKRMKCSCIPGRFLCGNYGLDISSVLNEVEGPVNIKCHDKGFSNCFIREFMVSKTLSTIIGDDAINMHCSVGQCLHYSQLPDYQKHSHSTSKSNMLVGIGTSLLTVYLVLKFIRRLVQAQSAITIRNGTDGNSSSKFASTELTDEKHGSSHFGQAEKDKKYKEANQEISNIMSSTPQATVSFRNISYTIPVQGPDLVSAEIPSESQPLVTRTTTGDQKELQLLEGVSGLVKPGEILAILGASGAGKSTLLDILARRDKCGKVSGKALINGKDLISQITTDEFHRMSGYVDQQDLHVATATVYEAVMTSAMLRLPRTMSLAAKKERTREVLVELGLWPVRNSRIGKSGARGISGGEMRRVSIACELVTLPAIIFLDEPTSGLDAYNAYIVMESLASLARQYQRTIICTIHQPRTDIFTMFDRLIILAAGKMCYSGPAKNIADYFASIGHPVPEGYNIADFSIDLVQQATALQAREVQESSSNCNSSQEDSSNEDENSEGWSPLLRSSQLSFANPDNTTEHQSLPGTQVYKTDIGLEQVLQKFQASEHRKRIIKELDGITGSAWTDTPFEMVSVAGSTPYMRPVTPVQQVKVIFSNLYDLVGLLYRAVSGNRSSQGPSSDKLRPTLYEQFKVLSGRIFRHLYRDPTLMLANYAISVLIGLLCGVLFYQLDNSVQGVQNRLGLLMFILAFYGFGSTTSLLVFSEERLLYLRERANAYYDPLAYFMAKITFDLVPLRVVPPLLLTLIAYPMTGLAATWYQLIKFFGTLVLFNLTVASQMLFIGLLAEELVVSNFLASIMLLFSLLFGGLILNKDSIPALLQPFYNISSFNLAYEALAVNELRHARIEEVKFGLEIELPAASVISSFGFNLLAFWPDVLILCSILVASLGLSLLWLTYVIQERR